MEYFSGTFVHLSMVGLAKTTIPYDCLGIKQRVATRLHLITRELISVRYFQLHLCIAAT